MASPNDWIFQFRKGTPEMWADSTYVLKYGEPGIEAHDEPTPDRIKLGDGVHLWADLSYVGGDEPVLVETVNETITVGAANTTADSEYGADDFVVIRTFTAAKTGTIYIKPFTNPNDFYDPDNFDLYIFNGGEAPPIDAPNSAGFPSLADIYMYKGGTNYSIGAYPYSATGRFPGVVGAPFDVVEGQSYDLVYWAYDPVTFAGVEMEIGNVTQQFETSDLTLFSGETYTVSGTDGKFVPLATAAGMEKVGTLPPGGAETQVLTKVSSTDGEARWAYVHRVDEYWTTPRVDVDLFNSNVLAPGRIHIDNQGEDLLLNLLNAGSALDGHTVVFRIKDDETPHAIAYSSEFRVIGDLPLPTSTIPGKTFYIEGSWNANTGTLDCSWDST